MNKKAKKDTKSYPKINKKFKEKLFLPKKENDKNDSKTNNNIQLKLEATNIFDENYLIDFRNNMKNKFKVTKSLKVYNKTDNNKKNLNRKVKETKSSIKNQTKSQNKKIKNNNQKNIKNNTIENKNNDENNINENNNKSEINIKNENNNKSENSTKNDNMDNKDNISQNNNMRSKDNISQNNNMTNKDNSSQNNYMRSKDSFSQNHNMRNKDYISQNHNIGNKDSSSHFNNETNEDNYYKINNINNNAYNKQSNTTKNNISNNNKNKSKNNNSDNNTKNNITTNNKDNISYNNTKDINSPNHNGQKNNIRKSNVKNGKNILSPKKNVTLKTLDSSPTKSKDKSNKVKKFDIFQNVVSKSKETISTNVDTLTLEKDKNEENKPEETQETVKAVFTPIPSLLRRTSKIISGQIPNAKDVEKAINLRRQQYNEYLKSLHKPKPKPKPKPKVYDLDNVIFIQKMYKGFQIKDVNQTVTRLKINLCVTELLCLILNNVFKHARKRITFYMFKTYYHDPFTHIFTEVNFTDKLAMKLSDTYYNFNNFY